MENKLIVHFNEMPVLAHNIDYLSYCKHCGTYNLGQKACVNCNEEEEISIDAVASYTVKKHFIIRELMNIAICVALFILAKDAKDIFIAILFSLIGIGATGYIFYKFKNELILNEMREHLMANKDKIKADLSKQMNIAIEDIEKGHPVEAYDRFRYLAKLIDNDEVRTYKLVCLRSFSLRSDMPLELKEMLQQEYNAYLVDYIYEVSKIKKDLVDDATLTYILTYKEEVLMKHKGDKILASVLEGALKSKFLLNKYAAEMKGYIKFFSRERLLRLCKMSKEIKDECVRRELLQEVKEVVGEDEAFKGYLSH